MRFHADCLVAIRIEDDDVCVRANGDRAFHWKQTKHFRRRSRSQFDKAIERDAILDHAAVDERDTMLNAGRAVGNLGEVILAEFLLLFHAEGAVVG